MSDKFKKIDKRFVLSDSTVNEYGFRLLTAGYQIGLYSKNPIGYYMHKRDSGVSLKWTDLAIEGDNVVGTPVINLSNERGAQMVDEVENGFLNAASVGHIVVLEYSLDPSLMLEGQTGPTITKWYNKECSLVDIPGNCNALTQLYDAKDNVINLADFSNKIKIENMNEVKLSLQDLAAMKDLGFTAVDAAGLLVQMKELKLKADNAVAETVTLKADKANLEIKVDTLKGEATDKEVNLMLDEALKAGKITVPIQTHLASVYKGKPELLKVDLEGRGAYTPIAANLSLGTGGGNTGEFADLQKLSWDDMHKTGKLPNLKSKYPDLYKEKYRTKYGVYPS